MNALGGLKTWKSSLHLGNLKVQAAFYHLRTLFPRLSDSTKSRFDLP